MNLVYYAVISGAAHRRTDQRGIYMARKREEQAEGGVSHGRGDAHVVLAGTYTNVIKEDMQARSAA